MLFCPLVMARRRLGRTGASALLGQLGAAAVEYVMLVVACVPLYWVSAWFSDATAADVIRSLLYLTAVALGAWGLSLCVLRGGAASAAAVGLTCALVALGLPVAHYLLAELTELSVSPGWLWSAAPATCAYSVAASRAAHWYPTPIWSWVLWPGVAAAVVLSRLSLGRRAE